MVSCSWNLHFMSEIVVPYTALGSSSIHIFAEGCIFPFRPHLGIGAGCHVRYKCRLGSTRYFCALTTCSKVHASTVKAVGNGEYETGDCSRKLRMVGAAAKSHELDNTEDIMVSSDGDGELTNKIPPLSDDERWRSVKQNIACLSSNAQKHSQGMQQVRQSLGVDFGDVKTGVSISLKGYAPRPLMVVRMRGDKLIEELLDIATREKVDEFIVGLPVSSEGKETVQSNKTRSFAGRLAGHAATRGWRVYLQDEYGSSQGGLDYMLEMGVKKRSRKEMIDAYAAVVLLSSYFNSKGARAQLVVPKGLTAQELLCLGSDVAIGANLDRVKGYDLDEDDNYEYDD